MKKKNDEKNSFFIFYFLKSINLFGEKISGFSAWSIQVKRIRRYRNRHHQYQEEEEKKKEKKRQEKERKKNEPWHTQVGLGGAARWLPQSN